MYDVEVTVPFDAAHIVTNHPNCENLHGHKLEVTVKMWGNDLIDPGFIMDFGIVKSWLRENVPDHRFILPKQKIVESTGKKHYHVEFGEDRFTLSRAHCAVLDIPEATSEYLAEYFFNQIKGLLPENVTRLRVEIQETPTSKAGYEEALRDVK